MDDNEVMVWGHEGRAGQLRIALYGASGMVGSRIAGEALTRGHRVTAISRSRGSGVPTGAKHRVGDAGDAGDVARVAAEHDVVVSAIGPSRAGQRHQIFLDAISTLIRNVGVRRLVVVGGAGTLESVPGVRLMDTPTFPKSALPEAVTQAAALALLKDSDGLVDWTYISPPPFIAPGERTGTYKLGLNAPAGTRITVEDFAVAIVDEIERPRHKRIRFTVAN